MAYRLFLGREGSGAEIAAMQAGVQDEEALRQVFLGSAEFAAVRRARISGRPEGESPLWHYHAEFDAEALIAGFHRPDQVPEPGVVRNFLGARIRPTVHPPLLVPLEGRIEGPPAPGNWHADIAEWASALRTVALAAEAGQGCYRMVELGCGWGCWMLNTGVAARARGLAVDLAGVEGDRGHLARAREMLALNGFAGTEFRLFHGIAGPRPGKAIFPDPAGGAQWGGTAEFYPGPDRLAAAGAAGAAGGVQVLEVLTLEALGGGGVVDLLHIDIQGAEADYVAGNMAAMERLVKRVLIGTHSREIEGRLMALFLSRGWRLEMERPALAPPVAGRPQIRIDGVQMWAGPACGAAP